MFLFQNNKAKAEIKVLEFSKNLSARQYDVWYTEDITSYIDNADNYMIIASAQISMNGLARNEYSKKWMPAFFEMAVSGNYITDVDNYPAMLLYNDGTSVKLKFRLCNPVDLAGVVKFRVALMRVTDVISA